MSVSTPPRLSASDISLTRLHTSRAASNVPTSNDTIPPNPRIWRLRQLVLRMADVSPG